MLRLHFVDEDYSSSRRSLARGNAYDSDVERQLQYLYQSRTISPNGVDQEQVMSVMTPCYDPNEPVPLYELSQEHQRVRERELERERGRSTREREGSDREERILRAERGERSALRERGHSSREQSVVNDGLERNGESRWGTWGERSAWILGRRGHSEGERGERSMRSDRSDRDERLERNDRNERQGRERTPRSRDESNGLAPKRLRTLGLKFLNARQHFLLAACRDVSLMPCLIGLSQSWWSCFAGPAPIYGTNSGHMVSHLDAWGPRMPRLTTARASERFLEGIWCIVAGYLLYSVLDGLMVRWIVSYSTTAAIVRMLSMSTILVAVERYLLAAFSAEGYNYGLHTWILISCALTLLYIVQNFITSNIDLKGKRRARFFDFYNIVVFAVVPVGLASFITMIGLLRSLLILRLDIDGLS